MARHEIELRKTATILDELNRLQQRIGERAYELFQRRGGQRGDALSDWLNAEHEMIWKPAVELRQKDDRFELLAALPGVNPKDVHVHVTPEAVLIQAENHHDRDAATDTIHLCELKAGKAFRTVQFPLPIDPESVTATCHDGLLQLTASMAKASAPRRVDVAA